MIDRKWMIKAEEELSKTVAIILQRPHRDTSRLMNLLVAKATGAAGATGILGIIGTFGTASTGTAIATLSGAALSKAKFFWLGSLIGGSAATGVVMTGGITLVAGYFGLKYFKGKPREIDDLTEEEKIIIDTSTKLCVGLKQDLDNNYYLTEEEQFFFKKVAWRPLLVKINKYADNDSTKTLNFKHVYAIQKQKEVLNELSHTI